MSSEKTDSKSRVIWEIPLKVKEANISEHWTKSRKRHKRQQFFIRCLFNREAQEISLPCTVILTRLSSHMLDDDNLVSAFKWIRDEVSEGLMPNLKKTYIDKKGIPRILKGRADNHPLIAWQYSQEKSKLSGIRIEFVF